MNERLNAENASSASSCPSFVVRFVTLGLQAVKIERSMSTPWIVSATIGGYGESAPWIEAPSLNISRVEGSSFLGSVRDLTHVSELVRLREQMPK